METYLSMIEMTGATTEAAQKALAQSEANLVPKFLVFHWPLRFVGGAAMVSLLGIGTPSLDGATVRPISGGGEVEDLAGVSFTICQENGARCYFSETDSGPSRRIAQ